MTTIYHVSEPNQDFVYLTHPPALRNVSEELECEFTLYNLADFAQRKFDKDSSNDLVWVIEAAYLEMSKMSIKELRSFFPNGKVVVISGDGIYHVRQGRHQINSPFEVDLWLDLMDEMVNLYRNMGVKTDSWIWSISQTMLDSFPAEEVDFSKKELDFVSFMSIGGNPYREGMVKYFHEKGCSFATGVSSLAKNTDQMIEAYKKAYFHVGSTSPGWTTGLRTMKGFRDAIAPYNNCLMLYDDHPDIRSKFGGGSIVPLYDYNSWDSLLNLMVKLAQDQELFKYYLSLQKIWVDFNTLEKQFMRMFRKHEIINFKKDNEIEKELVS